MRTAITGMVAVLGLLLVSASPAAAADGWQRTIDVADDEYVNGWEKTCLYSGGFPTNNAMGCFQPYGEWIWLKDTNANNEPVGLVCSYRNKDGGGERSGVAYWNGGKALGWTNLNKSFDDLGHFRFRVCEVNVSSSVMYVVESTCGSPTTVQT